jgi:hypothetical protein
MRLYTQDVVKTRLTSDLLAVEKVAAVNRIIQELPEFSDAVLECHLGGKSSRTDVSILLNRSIHELSASWHSHEAWQQCLKLSQILSDAHNSYRKYITEVWLEFDSEGHKLTMPIPCILVGLKPGEPIEILSEVAAQALKIPAERIAENLQACLANMPANANLLYVGRMWSRNANSLRVSIGNLAFSQVPELLQKNGWRGALAELDSILKQLSRYLETMVVSFDINGSAESRIGLECYFHRANESNPVWCNFLDYLVAENLCISHQACTLLQWPGIDYKGSSSYLRFITHIKIVIDSGQPLQAKVYLGLQQQGL